MILSEVTRYQCILLCGNWITNTVSRPNSSCFPQTCSSCSFLYLRWWWCHSSNCPRFRLWSHSGPSLCSWHLKWGSLVGPSPYLVGSVLTPVRVKIGLNCWTHSWCQRTGDWCGRMTNVWCWKKPQVQRQKTSHISHRGRGSLWSQLAICPGSQEWGPMTIFRQWTCYMTSVAFLLGRVLESTVKD